MPNQPIDIQEMFRRALAAQVDLGINELVIDPAALNAATNPAAALHQSSVVSVQAALSSGSGSGMESNAFSAGSSELSTEPQYDSLADHRDAICDCQACPLGAERNKFVYGVGNAKADIMFIGEAPGADEDRIGEPFVGRAGKLLDKILMAMELTRDQVYIANMLKCRPPGNRDPQPDEMKKCTPYLREQIRLIQPKVLCLLGRIAAHGILQTTTPLGKLRNQWHEFAGIPTIVTYHPAALLRFPAYKKDTWADMQELMRRWKEGQ